MFKLYSIVEKKKPYELQRNIWILVWNDDI